MLIHLCFLQTEFDGKESMGFGQQGEVHKLKKSLKFLRQSPKNFLKNFKAKLELVVSSFNNILTLFNSFRIE